MSPSRLPTEPTERARTQATEPTARARTRATAQTARAPTVLDRYRLARRLGTGAFGTVWLARDERLERDVAVKILARERIVGGRFEREARAAARLSHPAIVTLYEAAVDDDGAYLVSELVRGATLDALLAEGRLSDRDVVKIAIALGDALAHAHAQGVVHRDVKPSNVLIAEAPAGDAQVAKLTDFGVASVIGADSLTLTGDVLGTLAYMAPEQAAGLEAGPAADLYSLALVLYESLSGVNPQAGSAIQRSRRPAMRVAPLRRQRRDLPAALALAVDRALRPSPRDRGSLAELRAALVEARDRVGDEPGVIEPPWTTVLRRSRVGEHATERVERAAAGRYERSQPLAGRLREPTQHAPLDSASPPAWPPRALGAAATGAAVAWLAGTALHPLGLAPAAAGLVGAALVLALPRLGWAAVVGALCVTAAAQRHAGAALVLAAALLAPVVLLPARPTLWARSAAAPALGLVGLAGLAGAWPALAARAGTAWRRAVLGAVGWLWLALGGAIAGHGLYLARLPGTPAPAAWLGSPSQAVHHVLAPLATSGALAPALVWAAAAAVLPWLVRGRSLALDVVRVTIWAAILVSATGAALAAAHGAAAVGAPAQAALGAVAAVCVALAPHAAARWREALHSGGARARVP